MLVKCTKCDYSFFIKDGDPPRELCVKCRDKLAESQLKALKASEEQSPTPKQKRVYSRDLNRSMHFKMPRYMEDAMKNRADELDMTWSQYLRSLIKKDIPDMRKTRPDIVAKAEVRSKQRRNKDIKLGKLEGVVICEYVGCVGVAKHGKYCRKHMNENNR